MTNKKASPIFVKEVSVDFITYFYRFVKIMESEVMWRLVHRAGLGPE